LGEKHDPEAAYFLPESGKRTALSVFDLESSSGVPVVTESLFHNLNASATITPVMTLEDLLAGLQEAGSAAFGG
jgi:hypothetical protein